MKIESIEHIKKSTEKIYTATLKFQGWHQKVTISIYRTENDGWIIPTYIYIEKSKEYEEWTDGRYKIDEEYKRRSRINNRIARHVKKDSENILNQLKKDKRLRIKFMF